MSEEKKSLTNDTLAYITYVGGAPSEEQFQGLTMEEVRDIIQAGGREQPIGTGIEEDMAYAKRRKRNKKRVKSKRAKSKRAKSIKKKSTKRAKSKRTKSIKKS